MSDMLDLMWPGAEFQKTMEYWILRGFSGCWIWMKSGIEFELRFDLIFFPAGQAKSFRSQVTSIFRKGVVLRFLPNIDPSVKKELPIWVSVMPAIED